MCMACGKGSGKPYLVFNCQGDFSLKYLTSPEQTAIGKEISNPLFSMIHLSQDLTHLDVMRIVCN
jgi:hypothetical protein